MFTRLLIKTNPKTLRWAFILGIVAAIIPIIIIAIGQLTIAVGALLIAMALLGGPITLAILGFTALATLGTVLYKKWEPFRILIGAIIIGIKELFQFIKTQGGFLISIIPGLKLMNIIKNKFIQPPSIGNTGSTSKIDANININAPKGVVGGVRTEQKAGPGVDLGVNLEEIYAPN